MDMLLSELSQTASQMFMPLDKLKKSILKLIC